MNSQAVEVPLRIPIPKIDKVSYVVQNANFDLVCITKTWLRKDIPNNTVDIAGFNLIRLDRKETINGRVCIFIRDSIQFSTLSDLSDDSLEVLWIKIRPSRQPRGISDIIVGLVYHPPAANNSVMLDYLTNQLIDLESKCPSSGIIPRRDFNQLNVSRLTSNFGFNQIVNFGTRGLRTLDKVLTNLKSFYDQPIKRPGFGLFDHFSIEVQPK